MWSACPSWSQGPLSLAALNPGTLWLSRARSHNPTTLAHKRQPMTLSAGGSLPVSLRLHQQVGKLVKLHCRRYADARDAGGVAPCRYNDSADIAPPHLCSTPASSEAETLNARRRPNKRVDRPAATLRLCSRLVRKLQNDLRSTQAEKAG